MSTQHCAACGLAKNKHSGRDSRACASFEKKRQLIDATQFNLTWQDWHEIYNALEDGTTKRRLAFYETDGRMPTEKQITALSDSAWIEIFLAVQDKYGRLKDGLYGGVRQKQIREWQDHMAAIVNELDIIRTTYISGAPNPNLTQGRK